MEFSRNTDSFHYSSLKYGFRRWFLRENMSLTCRFPYLNLIPKVPEKRTLILSILFFFCFF
ncbi:hypothetical protein LEP1GSC193_0458 [Leptospira alstonii serovar Pingchang str. 80-412]|uniref:Uncharacterized protein n=1 Tax=Leptospira alstonii serovar Pingchang str. 80-412 TaxID=1218564 RepID=T0FZX4_9LEPT|nr:hypothetical protein LEP1GSC193_0458 [Leptospira alstonii serovar Pingchang str. 80-412]